MWQKQCLDLLIRLTCMNSELKEILREHLELRADEGEGLEHLSSQLRMKGLPEEKEGLGTPTLSQQGNKV